MSARPPWKPSRGEQRALFYLQMLMRYVIGGGGLVWELTVDKLHNSIALLVFGALATSTDMIFFARTLIRQARNDRMYPQDEPPDEKAPEP